MKKRLDTASTIWSTAKRQNNDTANDSAVYKNESVPRGTRGRKTGISARPCTEVHDRFDPFEFQERRVRGTQRCGRGDNPANNAINLVVNTQQSFNGMAVSDCYALDALSCL
jgi:hypothetical protein